MKLIAAFTKSRKYPLLVIPGLCTPLGIVVFPLDLTEVPLRFGVNTVPLLIFAFLSGILFTPFFVSPNREMESMLPRQKMFLLRGIWVTILAVFFGAVSAGYVWHLYDEFYAIVFLRNFILGYSLNLILQTVINPRLSWVPTTLYALLIWFIGSTDSIATPRLWAIILYLDFYSPLNYFAAIAFVLAASLYVIIDGKEI